MVYDVFGQNVAEYSGSTLEREHIYRGGGLLAIYEAGASALRYVLTDAQGSTRAILNSNSTVMARHDYLPFGEEIGAGIGLRSSGQGFGATDTNRQKYGLTERDATTGLDHTWWRKYENLGGRWTSPDPLRGIIGAPQSFNAYNYAGNDPVNFVDPAGLDPQGVLGGLLGLIPGMGPGTSTITVPISWNDPISRHGGIGGDGTEWVTLAVLDRTSLNQGGAQNTSSCTFNINISGISGQELTDMQNEITRIFDSADLGVVFNRPNQANGGSWNVVVTPQFTGAVAASLGSDINNIARLGRTIIGSGETQVNSSHIFLTHGGGMAVRPQSFASYGTITGRIAAHEVIAHGFIPTESHPDFLPKDITKPWSRRESIGMSGARFGISEQTVALLRSRCR
jgi:RHS repeat-associated protein